MRTVLGLFIAGVLLAALPTGLKNRGTQFPYSNANFSFGINGGHPLSAGLVMFIPFNRAVASLTYPDLTNHSLGLINNGTGLSVVATPYGFGVTGFAHGTGNLTDNNNAYFQKFAPSGSAARTSAVLFRLLSTGDANYKPLIFWGNCGSGPAGWLVFVGGNASGYVGAGDVAFDSTVAFTQDLNWHIVTGVFPGTSTNSNTSLVYIDGKNPSPGGIGSNDTINTDNTSGFVGDAPGGCTGSSTNLVIAGVWVWNRALSQREVQLLSADPFGMMYDPAAHSFGIGAPSAGSMPPVIY